MFLLYEVERLGFSIAYTIAADASAIALNQSSKGAQLSSFYYGYTSSQVRAGWAAQKTGGRKWVLVQFLACA